MDWIVYEHPLEEKTRVYLRIEALLKQIEAGCQCVDTIRYPLFFGGLFNLLDLLERTDVRADLIKDLERREGRLQAYINHPAVDQERLKALHSDLQTILQALCEGHKFGYALRDNRFLANLRQRMGIMGGQCHHELPEFQRWLQQPEAARMNQAMRWFEQLAVLQHALHMELKMVREQTDFEPYVAENGSWQSNDEKLSLLRIRVDADLATYPLVSGHRQRFTIRFMQANGMQGTQERIHFNESVPFQLARCPG